MLKLTFDQENKYSIVFPDLKNPLFDVLFAILGIFIFFYGGHSISGVLEWRPSWIPYSHLMPGVQDLYPSQICSLGLILQ